MSLLLHFFLKRTLCFFALLSVFSLTSHAQDSPSAKPQTKVTLLADVAAITPGEPFTVALQLEHPEHWHSYYHHDGIGFQEPHKWTWELPAEFTASPLRFPVPKKIPSYGLTSYAYEGTVIIQALITPSKDLKTSQSITLNAKATWQICDPTGCIPESYEIKLTLPVAEHSAPNEAVLDQLKRYNKKNLPQTAPNDWIITASEKDQLISLSIKSPTPLAKTPPPSFYEFDKQVDAQKKHSFLQEGSTSTLQLPRNQGNSLNPSKGPTLSRLKGILSLNPSTHYWIDTPLLPPAEPSDESSELTEPPQKAGGSNPLLTTLLSLFIGGLILNLMPCVFPVIGIKIMGFVEQAGHDRKKVILHGLAFSLGVLVSFWVLSTLIFLGGLQNWGSQLENPHVMLGLIAIMLLLAMNMYGVFEIGASATGVGSKLTRKDGLSGSFFSGLLATIVATPCSAPFLGPALATAITLPTFQFYLAFTLMALGLSLPYLVLSIFPNLVKKLPRPGAWMESFKQGMSFLLFATVGYLLWVYSAQVFEQDHGQKGLFVMIGLSLIATSAWIWGRWTTPIRKKNTKLIARLLSLAFFITGLYFAKSNPPELQTGPPVPSIDWQKWSKKKEQDLLAEGSPVFIDFTAKWCLTCQVNKKTAYTTEVIALMQKKGIVFLQADKTSTNPAIDEELKKLNRSAIPVNVLYTPQNPDTPHITDELLTPGYMLDFVKQYLPE